MSDISRQRFSDPNCESKVTDSVVVGERVASFTLQLLLTQDFVDVLFSGVSFYDEKERRARFLVDESSLFTIGFLGVFGVTTIEDFNSVLADMEPPFGADALPINSEQVSEQQRKDLLSRVSAVPNPPVILRISRLTDLA